MAKNKLDEAVEAAIEKGKQAIEDDDRITMNQSADMRRVKIASPSHDHEGVIYLRDSVIQVDADTASWMLEAGCGFPTTEEVNHIYPPPKTN